MKKVWISAIVVLLLAIVCWLNINVASSQKDVAMEKPTDVLGEFPVINGLVSPAYHIPFFVDTTCDLSMITQGSIDELKRRGCRVDSTMLCPVFFRDVEGSVHFTTKRYSVDFPIQEWEVDISSDGSIFYICPDDEVVNVLKNVNFVPAPHNMSVIGLDIMKHCAVEFKLTPGTLTFYKSAPDGYDTLCDIYKTYSASSILGFGDNYNLDLTISGRNKSYIIDTALDQVHVKMPASDSVYAQSQLVDMSVLTATGNLIQTKCAEREWSFLGDRAGNTAVYYFDDGTKYGINPFRFSSQDVLLDLPGKRLCYRPTYTIPDMVK